MQWTAWRTVGGQRRPSAVRSAGVDHRAVARADAGTDARRDGRLCPPCGRVGRWPPGKNSRPPGGRPADDEADGRAHFHRSERPSTTPRP